jgi:uncharacterized membrane protein YiaA
MVFIFPIGDDQMAAHQIQQPSSAFVGASWAALAAGMSAYLAFLWNSNMALNEKGYYFIVLMYGLFSAISVQKAVRDRIEGTRVTGIYYGLCWFSLFLCLILITVGLWNSSLPGSEKGFYGMSFVLSLFASIAVQKNVRDSASAQAPTTAGIARSHDEVTLTTQ